MRSSHLPGKGKALFAQVAREFGICESCLHRRLGLADIEDGIRRGVTASDSVDWREAKKRIRRLEQEAEVVRRGVVYRSRGVNPSPCPDR